MQRSLESEFPGRLSISSQPLGSGSSGPFTGPLLQDTSPNEVSSWRRPGRRSRAPGLARWRWRGGLSARTALPTGRMTRAPQSVLPRLPQHHLPGEGSPAERAGLGGGRSDRLPPPRGADHRKEGGGGREGNGGRERSAVNKELPLCEVRRWVPSSRLPEGPLCSSAHSGAVREPARTGRPAPPVELTTCHGSRAAAPSE